VNGGPAQTLTFAVTTDFNTLGVMNVTLHLSAGSNTIAIGNPTDNAPDFGPHHRRPATAMTLEIP
jgi:hypothetical protein